MVFAFIMMISELALSLDNAYADQVVATIPVGHTSGWITVNPNTDKIYVVTVDYPSFNGYVSVINGNTNSIISTIPMGNDPSDIKVNPTTNMIYVGNFNSHSISVIDGNTDTLVNTISNVGPVWGLGVNPVTNLIYAADYGNGNGIYIINGTTNVIVQHMPFAYNEIAHQPAVNPSTNMVYVPVTCSYCHQSYITVIDGNNSTRLLNIPAGMVPSYADANPTTNMIYVSDDASNYQLDVINGTTNNLSTIPMGLCAYGVGVNPNTNRIYVPNCQENYTYIVDGNSNSIIDKLPLGGSPSHVAVDPITNKIYVSNGDQVSVIQGNLTTPDFGISQYPSTHDVYVPVGSSANTSIAVTSYDGFTGTVSLSSSSPLKTSLIPSSVNVSSGGLVQSNLTISVPASANSGQYSIMITGTNGTMSHSVILTVMAYPVTPSAPQNLVATTTSSSQINLSWTEPTTNGGSAITGYMIEKSADRGTTWSTIVPNTDNSGTTYSDTGLTQNSTYTYRVSAINSVGTSLPSNTASATTFTVPNAPTNLASTAVSSSQINLSWTAPSKNGGTPITGYQIQRSTDGGSTWSTIVANTGSTTTSYSDTGLQSNTAYTYQVSAINAVGTGSPSNTASATTPLLSAAGINVGPVSTSPLP